VVTPGSAGRCFWRAGTPERYRAPVTPAR
jgi:hypothetical protein